MPEETEGNKGSEGKEEQAKTPPEGDKPKMVPESDLLAVKNSLGEKLTKAEQAAATAIADAEAAKASLSEAQQSKYQLEARVTELETQVKDGTSSKEELERVKGDLTNANKSVEGLTTKVLESRRRELVATFSLNPEVVKDKTLEQLDSFEEALKAVAAAKGIGNFAVGGVTGGGQAPTTGRQKMQAGFEALHPSGE